MSSHGRDYQKFIVKIEKKGENMVGSIILSKKRISKHFSNRIEAFLIQAQVIINPFVNPIPVVNHIVNQTSMYQWWTSISQHFEEFRSISILYSAHGHLPVPAIFLM